MLLTPVMGSRRHQSLPFGCTDGDQNHNQWQRLMHADEPHGVHGIGLPSFVNNPGPPGRPLLSEQESEQMQDFFSNFDGEGQQHSHPIPPQFQDSMTQMQQLQMPQQYVGHETYVRSPQEMQWHQQATNNFQFGNHMNTMPTLHTPTSPFTNGHVTSPVHPMYPMNQPNVQNFNNGWPQFPNPGLHSRPEMNFGSDPNFMNSHYTAPDGTMDAELSLLTYGMQPASSASNTQPNSRANSNPNTEPSSPIATKKRKLNAFQTDALRMTSSNGALSNGVVSRRSPPPPASQRKQRTKSFVKHEEQPRLSKSSTLNTEHDVQEEDAEYNEDEEEQSQSPPAPWPSSKARPQHKPPPPSKPSKARKKSVSIASPAKPKPRRASSSTTTITRTPLSAEQKRMNHTSSEQRRRDATARSYAELYDLVPELEETGKQSTMKKLELVVEKTRHVKSQVEYLRTLLGRDPITGRILPAQIATTQFGGEMAHLSGWH